MTEPASPTILWHDTSSPLVTRILSILRVKGMVSEELISEILQISSRSCRDCCLEIADCGIITPVYVGETLMWRHISEKNTIGVQRNE